MIMPRNFNAGFSWYSDGRSFILGIYCRLGISCLSMADESAWYGSLARLEIQICLHNDYSIVYTDFRHSSSHLVVHEKKRGPPGFLLTPQSITHGTGNPHHHPPPRLAQSYSRREAAYPYRSSARFAARTL